MAKNGQESGPRSFGDLDCLDRSLGSIACFFFCFFWCSFGQTYRSQSAPMYIYIYIFKFYSDF